MQRQTSLTSYKRLIGIELGRQQYWLVLCDKHHVLYVPEIYVWLQRKHHPFFQHQFAPSAQDRLLLMPPCSDTVTDQHVVVRPSGLLVLVHRKLPEVVHLRTGAAAIDSLAIDLQVNGIVAPLIGRWRAHDHGSRLMPWITVQVGHIVCSDRVALLDHYVALAAVGHGILECIKNAVRPFEAEAKASTH